MTIPKFQKIVWDYYNTNKRALPWRDHIDPYWVLVSEIMLQQTQVPRGLVKFPEFITAFPTIKSLAEADTVELLRVWQGLGYNRRALFLKRSAEIIMAHHHGVIPQERELLERLPGIGPNTAGSISVFAFNTPLVFIETNIRTVFLHHFFSDETEVHDALLMPLIAKSLDKKNPREWYWALMDYGTYLKKEHGNASRRSRHYTKQSKFAGSLRQLRGAILRFALNHPQFDVEMIQIDQPTRTRDEIETALGQLVGEGFIEIDAGVYQLKS